MGEAVKGAVSVGDAPPRAGERGEWGTLRRVGCPEWESGCGGQGVEGTPRWTTMGDPDPWAG